MIKQSECEGVPILNYDNGNVIGRFKEFLFLGDVRKVYGFFLEDSFLGSNKVVLLEDVIRLGKDIVIVDGKNVIRKLKKVLKKNNLEQIYQIRNKEVYTNKGMNLGTVKDIRVNELSGEIEFLEISNGIISDIINGRSILPLIGKVLFSDDGILVENQAYEELQFRKKSIV